MCSDGANVADFLTGVTVPVERQIRPGLEAFPRNNTELRNAYQQSPIKAAMECGLSYPTSEEAKSNTQTFIKAMQMNKSKHLPVSSPMTVSFYCQVQACVARQYQVIWSDKATFLIKQSSTLCTALVSSSPAIKAIQRYREGALAPS